MKRILIALAVLLSVQVADAQTKTPEVAKKAVEAADAAAQNPKKAVKVATWLKLATSYMDAYNAPAGNAWVGATKQELALLMAGQKPVSVESVVIEGQPFQKEIYADKEFYFNEAGQLLIINVTKPVVEDALAKAVEAYKKAYEVDVKKSKVKDINTGLQTIAQKYLDEGMNSYTFGNLAEASQLFEKCLENKYYYEGGEVYAKLADVYKNLGDSAKAVETLETGFSAFPQSQSILIGLINYYIESGENADRLFVLIDEAKKNEPNNASLYYVEGNIHKQLGNVEKAVESYYECSKINPDYEFGYIGAGILYYERAVELSDKASNEFDDKKYEALVAQVEEALLNALEPFEKAYSVSKDPSLKVSIAEYLKNIYYRFSSKGAQYEEGYNKYNEIVRTGNVN